MFEDSCRRARQNAPQPADTRMCMCVCVCVRAPGEVKQEAATNNVHLQTECNVSRTATQKRTQIDADTPGTKQQNKTKITEHRHIHTHTYKKLVCTATKSHVAALKPFAFVCCTLQPAAKTTATIRTVYAFAWL